MYITLMYILLCSIFTFFIFFNKCYTFSIFKKRFLFQKVNNINPKALPLLVFTLFLLNLKDVNLTL